LLATLLAFAGQAERDEWKRLPRPAAPEPKDPAVRARIAKWDALMDGMGCERRPIEDA
jgi:hypothetical protein